MILVNSYEEELFTLLSKALEYYVRKSQYEEGRTAINEFDVLRNALLEMYDPHFNKILSNYESFIKEKMSMKLNYHSTHTMAPFKSTQKVSGSFL
jgi:hypothetical protein